MSIKSHLAIIWVCILKFLRDSRQLTKGQKVSFEILQLSHRLEKGLLYSNPKPFWGWDKAERLAYLLGVGGDTFSKETAKAVLGSYLKAKETFQKEEITKVNAFRTHFGLDFNNCSLGGLREFEYRAFEDNELRVISNLFVTRHSCRDFSDLEIDDVKLKEAVALALRCPSACNRQPFKVYVIKPADLEDLIGHPLQYSGNRNLVITGDIRAFTKSEILDWLISPSIFVGYLTLALHAMGIGSCVVKKDLVRKSKYNDAIRMLTGMEDSEEIVLELFIGYYKDSYYAPVSNRRDPSDVMVFV